MGGHKQAMDSEKSRQHVKAVLDSLVVDIKKEWKKKLCYKIKNNTTDLYCDAILQTGMKYINTCPKKVSQLKNKNYMKGSML